MICHSPESWRKLWDGEVFKKGSVRVDTILQKVERADLPVVKEGAIGFYLLFWAVTRI